MATTFIYVEKNELFRHDQQLRKERRDLLGG